MALTRKRVLVTGGAGIGKTMTIGWYHDRYVEQGGLWRFARRHWNLKYRGAPDLTGLFADTPNYGALPDGPADDEATYVRPT